MYGRQIMYPIRSWPSVAGAAFVVALGMSIPALGQVAAAPGDGSVLPFPPPPSASMAAPRLQDSEHQRRIEAARLPKDAPNILIVLLDDVGFGLPDTYGGPIHTPTLIAHRRRGHQLQRISHDRDLLAHARGAADRAQPSARRLRHDRRARGGLGRLHRRHSADLRHGREGAGRLRLQDGRVRQVAQHAGDRDDGDGAVRPLADRRRHRLRLFLRLPRRRDLAMGAAAGREPQPGRAAARREISSERRPGGQGDRRGCAGIARTRPTSRSSCTGRQAPRTGRTTSSRSGPTSTKASSTTAGMRCASAPSRVRRSSAGFPPIPSSPRAPTPWPRGTASRSRSARSSGG